MKITVLFLIYNGSRFVKGLVEGIRAQKHPAVSRQEDWLEVMFMDNGSRDDTAETLKRELAAAGNPAHYRVVTNPVNLGYAGAVNEAFRLTTTEFLLTCHCDARFGSDDYVATMLAHISANPNIAAITGQPTMPPGPLPFAEKLNLVAYLVDIFPPKTDRPLVDVGFVEGRCDVFRVAAVKQAGMYDTRLRTAGEDQILSARMRQNGFRTCQAPALRYYLSVSDEQDTVGKLIRHMVLFGRVHPTLLLRAPATVTGITGDAAGPNRRRRMQLRVNQLATIAAYVALPIAIVAGWPWPAIAFVALVAAWRLVLYARHLAVVRMGAGELARFFALQPAFDVAYFLGVVRGLYDVVGGKSPRS